MICALALLLVGNALAHADALGFASGSDVGNRLGGATLVMLVILIGGRIVPSFTRNWLAKQDPNSPAPPQFNSVDRIALISTTVALLAWAFAPEAPPTPWLELTAGGAIAARLARWRGTKSLAEPLLWVLHLDYGWLAIALLLLGLNGLTPLLPHTAAIHALTVGSIGTMTLAVMTRATLGHTGRALVAGKRTTAIYAMITIAALLRLLAPVFGPRYSVALWLSAVAWCSAFGGFALFYFPELMRPDRP